MGMRAYVGEELTPIIWVSFPWVEGCWHPLLQRKGTLPFPLLLPCWSVYSVYPSPAIEQMRQEGCGVNRCTSLPRMSVMRSRAVGLGEHERALKKQG